MRREIVRVSPLRYAVVLAAIAFALSLLAAAALALLGGLGAPGGGGPPGMPEGGAAMLLGAVLAQTAGGFVGGLVIAAVYNFVARVLGGVVIDLGDA